MPITNIRLPAALEKFVASQVLEGRYRSREAAIVARGPASKAPQRAARMVTDRNPEWPRLGTSR
jgi:hypothetical protein